MHYIKKIDFIGKESYYDLVNGCFISGITANKDTFWDFEKVYNSSMELKKGSDFLCITIAITDACNLRCKYCFEQHGKKFLEEGSIDDICILIQKYKKRNTNVKRVVVIWFGGEPTLNLDYIHKATSSLQKTCRQFSLHFSARIITNGVELQKIIPYIEILRITDIQITLDGTQEFHDSRRIKADGSGSFETIIENITNIHCLVDLIIRVNVDQNNIFEVYSLYDFILQLPLDKQVNIYFQPMLVENYGGESTCYDGMILSDEKLNEDFLDLLEYTNTLEYPRFIGAFCNVNFPGSLVIGADARLCKCWAKVGCSEKNSLLLEDQVDQIVDFMMADKSIINERCEKCEIFPTCLGGCTYINYTKSECAIRRKMLILTIKRLFFKKLAETEIRFKLLYNEKEWLKSIGCQVRYTDNGLSVRRLNFPTTDFNFHVGLDLKARCVRLSDLDSRYLIDEKKAICCGFTKDLEYDINYYCAHSDAKVDADYVFSRVSLGEWCEDGNCRVENKYTRYYNIYYKTYKIGKCALIVTSIVGIYDFEIEENFRGKGHGSKALQTLISRSQKDLYIQTWNENIMAQKCYEKAGFKVYEHLYRYV